MNALRIQQGAKPPLMPFADVSPETVDFIFQAVPHNTRKAYESASRRFAEWLDGRQPDDSLLAEYVRELFDRGKSAATISLAVAAVNWVAKYAGHGTVAGVATREALKAARRMGSARRRGQVSPLTREDLKVICHDLRRDKSPRALRDVAIIRLMSDALLRVSELCALNVADVKFQENAVFVARSKTDQEAEGVHLFVTSATLKSIRHYLDAAGIEDGALFRGDRTTDLASNTRIDVDALRKIIKRRAKESDIDGFISGHSLRVGMTVSLAKRETSIVEIQTAGRWKSPRMPAHYASAELASQGAVARHFEHER